MRMINKVEREGWGGGGGGGGGGNRDIVIAWLPTTPAEMPNIPECRALNEPLFFQPLIGRCRKELTSTEQTLPGHFRTCVHDS